MTPQYPLTFAEQNLAGDVHIRPEDIADYTYPQGRRSRYITDGWEKAKALGIAEIDVRDFGAIPTRRKAMMTKWEYVLVHVERDVNGVLADYGEKGWEMCGVTPEPDGALCFYFKRVLPSTL